MIFDLRDDLIIIKNGINEGLVRKKPKRLKNQIDKVKQPKKGLNNMQKKIEFAFEINQKMAKSFSRSENKTENQKIKEKNNFAGITLTKQQRLFLERKGLDIFLDRYPQFA